MSPDDWVALILGMVRAEAGRGEKDDGGLCFMCYHTVNKSIINNK